MNNFLVTYSSIPNEGFSNFIYKLADNSIDMADIEHYSACSVLLPYDFKNIIEPKCFNKSTLLLPKIFPIIEKTPFDSIEKLNHILIANSNFQHFKNDNVKINLIDYEEYEKSFLKIQDYLQRGDIYEMNYCIPFIFQNIEITPSELFIDLLKSMTTPFNALLKIDNEYILSFSPERFLKKIQNTIFTEPIKGTAPRSVSASEDEKNKQELKNNMKEKTENAMIVDVSRNDLSKIAKKGSVRVDELFSIKTYGTVHQMVSKISCILKDNISFKDIIYATFPMASMTGAPKIRAMQIADELEKYPREYYSGALGIYENGNFDLSVLIRSIFYNSSTKELKIWAGSAVTIYTTPEKEYQECLLKVNKLIDTIKKTAVTKKI